jgi:hypothetical protein
MRAAIFGSRERNPGRRLASQRSPDSRGLPWIAVDLGTRSGLVPSHLWAGVAQLLWPAAPILKRLRQLTPPRRVDHGSRPSGLGIAVGEIGRKNRVQEPRCPRRGRSLSTSRGRAGARTQPKSTRRVRLCLGSSRSSSFPSTAIPSPSRPSATPSTAPHCRRTRCLARSVGSPACGQQFVSRLIFRSRAIWKTGLVMPGADQVAVVLARDRPQWVALEAVAGVGLVGRGDARRTEVLVHIIGASQKTASPASIRPTTE